ncbi:unnamed protein product [Cuscuta epithymum]|uniref:Uncharacterized protein n=1 Tax=Cuscuta epithymum TaxID=186058 RepID=A0AAV0EVR1_9ASTE|nr:unnamed protein product [Cuscuta epithymum]
MYWAAMETGKSYLNPHAEVYVPLFQREGGNKDGLLPSIVKPAEFPQQFPQSSEPHSIQPSPSDNLYASSSQGQSDDSEPTDTQLMDMQYNFDMNCLRTNFHDISEESLSHVYILKECDLNETIDMLNQLELPDCLYIGDESEPGPSSKAANQKLKKSVTGEACSIPASSGSSCSKPVN